jgi:hypothetical protein
MLMLVDQHYSMDDNYGPRPDPRTRLCQDTGLESEAESPSLWNSSSDRLSKTKVRVNLSNSNDLCGGEEVGSEMMYLMSSRRAGGPPLFLYFPGGQRGSTESGDGGSWWPGRPARGW